jgi:hypothetical protein
MSSASCAPCRSWKPAARLVSALPLLMFLSVLGGARAARAAEEEDGETVGKITLLNRKAVEEYQNLNFDDAQRLLRDALELSATPRLAQNPIRARTYVNLGMVTFGGLRQRDAAIKLFRKALRIEPEIRLSRALANPQIQEVFDEAIRGLGSEPSEAVVQRPAELSPDQALMHEPVRAAIAGHALSIGASADRRLPMELMVLSYRPAGAEAFLEVKMQPQGAGVFAGVIPVSATTAGGHVQYFIEARGANGKRLAAQGSAADPIVVVLSGALPEIALTAPEGPSQPGSNERHLVFAVMTGTGFGWTSGMGEVRQQQVTPSGFAWARVAHIAPEIAYRVNAHLMLGVQGRIQIITGATEFRPPDAAPSCGSDGVCSPAKAAFAAFAKGTWFFRDPSSAFRPYVSLSLGGGLIRHVAQAGNKTDCGASQHDKCLDTVAEGPILFGPGAGFHYRLSDGFGLVLAIEALAGAPTFSMDGDTNLGVAYQF